jgi:hypothetical protein
VHVPAWALGEPAPDQLGLGGARVIGDDVDVELGRDRSPERAEEPAELGGPVPPRAPADDGPRPDVERGDERGRAVARRAVAGVVVRAPLGLAAAQREERLRPVERLAPVGPLCGLTLVDAQDRRPIRRVQGEPDHVAHLGDGRRRVDGEPEGLGPVRLQPGRAPRPAAWGATGMMVFGGECTRCTAANPCQASASGGA